MPSLAKYFALVVLVAWPACLTAQTPAPSNLYARGAEMPPAVAVQPGRQLTAAANQAAIPLPPPRHDASVPLPSPDRSSRATAAKPGGFASPTTMAGSLAIVLGLFFAVVWVMRGAKPKGSVLLPGEVVEVLGRAPLAGRQQMHLLRCGNKLLLVSVTSTGAETLTEVTDPLEVDRLAGLCRQAHPQSATAAFRQVLQQFGPKAESRNA